MQLTNFPTPQPHKLCVKTKPLPKYPFLMRAKYGSMLFVGEGNLSFSLSIAKQLNGRTSNMVSTVYENRIELAKETLHNGQSLLRLGAKVYCSIDATKLHKEFSENTFDTICFQFPNIASRQPKYGRNPNHHLLVKYLGSARQIKTKQGHVTITIVNRPHYDGAFAIEEAAEKAGYLPPKEYIFRSSDFPTYNHTNTLNEDSAIAKYRSFRTYCFKSS